MKEENKTPAAGYKEVDRMTRTEVLTHFGYEETESTGVMPNGVGLWPRGSVFERILQIPEFLHLKNAEEKKFRIILDHDPKFHIALFQYQENPEDQRTRQQGQPAGTSPNDPEVQADYQRWLAERKQRRGEALG